MDGFININKSPGMTSFDVIKKLKKYIPKTKLGHLGTLDPMARGVLPVAVGYATRLIEYANSSDKIYQAAMTLGGISDTQDAWGNIVYQAKVEFTEKNLIEILRKYTGLISQVPPMYSALHYQGQRLYDLARQGITVDREARTIEIEYIKLISLDKNNEGLPIVKIEVQCSKGTYIRTLCHDIGAELGTGAYLSALTRTRAGVFSIEESFTLDEIGGNIDNWGGIIKPADYPLKHLGQVVVEGQALHKILDGNRVLIEEILMPGLVRVYEPEGKLAAIAHCQAEVDKVGLQPIKVFR